MSAAKAVAMVWTVSLTVSAPPERLGSITVMLTTSLLRRLPLAPPSMVMFSTVVCLPKARVSVPVIAAAYSVLLVDLERKMTVFRSDMASMPIA
jgi:hypothetical protein